MTDARDDGTPNHGVHTSEPPFRPRRAAPVIAVATQPEAEEATAALTEAGERADVHVVAGVEELGDGATLVVGTLADRLGADALGTLWRDYLPSPYTAHELARRLAVLRERTAELNRQIDEKNDLGIIVRSIADAVRVAVLFFDESDRPRLRNKMVDEILGLTGYDAATGRSTHVYAPGRRTPAKRGADIVTETLKGDGRGIIYWVGDPDHDEQRAIITEAHHVTRPDGTRLGSAVVSYDVTDLANAIEEREDYLASVSHELRTPLTAIVGYLDLIAEGYDIAELGFRREFEMIERNLEQLTALINQFLLAGSGEQSLRREPTDLKALLTRSVTAVQPAADAARLHLDLDLPRTPLLGLVDGTRIRQVIDNLVSNAVKYTPEGGRIEVALEHRGDDACIRITNTGPGLTKSDQARIFDRFFRTQGARESAARGVGIGLSIAKNLVDAHDGTIAVDSRLGRDTTFTVTLPLRHEGAPLARLPETP